MLFAIPAARQADIPPVAAGRIERITGVLPVPSYIIITAAEIAAFKPLVGVVGNCDNYDLRWDYPVYKVFECEGMKVLMTHIGGYPGRYDPQARRLIDFHEPDIFVCGHSHILKVMRDEKRKMLTINPGASGVQGFHVVRTALRFHIDNGQIHNMEVFELDR